MSKGKELKRLINDKKILVMPGVYDCISAKVVQHLGFKVAVTSGAGISESFLGYPDMGFLGLNENLTVVRHIANSTDLLISSDIDTGYGNALNVYYTVKAFEDAGVAGIQIEDQVWPKRCGHLEGKKTISAEEMVEKIHAAVDAKRDPDFVIQARTDAAGTIGLKEAIRRANLYREAGADILFADALLSKEDIKTFVENVDGPVKVNMGLAIRKRPTTPLISLAELEEMGVAAVSFPRLTTASAIKGMLQALSVVNEMIEKDGILIERPELVVSFNEIQELMGLPVLKELEERYAVKK